MGIYRACLLVVVAALTLSACGPDTTPKPEVEVGAAGSACPMPVSFEVKERWKPKATEPGNRMGGAELLCEIDGKPAGTVGFLRVWQSAKDPDLMAVLKRFVDGPYHADYHYKDVTVGSFAAKEVTYLNKGLDLEAPVQVLAVPVGGGTVLLAIGGIDKETFDENVPTYELAKSSLKATA